MSDLGVAEIPVDEDERPLPPPEAPAKNALLDGPILPRYGWRGRMRLRSPPVCVVIAETSYVGRLGTIARGDGIGVPVRHGDDDDVRRRDGRRRRVGDRARARRRRYRTRSTLAAHALLIGLCFGLTFMLGMLIFGPKLLELLGGRGNVLTRRWPIRRFLRRRRGAVADEHDVGHPARHRQHEAAVAADALLGHLPDHSRRHAGPGPRPDPAIRHARRRGGPLIAYPIQHLPDLLVSVLRPRERQAENARPSDPQRGMFLDILKVGAIACLSPLQAVITVSIFTGLLARYGTYAVGYGIGARLELLVGPIAAAIGIASVPLVGMKSAPQHVERARGGGGWPDWPGGRLSARSGASFSRSRQISGRRIPSPTRARARRGPAISHLAEPRYAFLGLALSLLFLLAGIGEDPRPGAGADRAAVVHRYRWVVVVDA